MWFYGYRPTILVLENKGFSKSLGGVFTRSTYEKCRVSTRASTGYILGDTCTSNMFMVLLYIYWRLLSVPFTWLTNYVLIYKYMFKNYMEEVCDQHSTQIRLETSGLTCARLVLLLIFQLLLWQQWNFRKRISDLIYLIRL